MSTFALIVAAHGSDADPSVNRRVQGLATQAAALAGFDAGMAAFHQGSPRFAQALDLSETDHAVVVPLMTSDGYYCATVLPHELIKNRRYDRMMVHKTPPVGTHPSMVSLVESRARRLLTEYGVAPQDTALAIVGHGTRRYVRSRAATEALASALERRGGFHQVITAFLDDEPGIVSIRDRTTAHNVVVEPFFISDAHHVTVDVPRQLGFDQGGSVRSATIRHEGEGFVLCDTAVGIDEAMLGVVIARAVHGRTVLGRRVAGAA